MVKSCFRRQEKSTASFSCIYATVNWGNGNVTFTPVHAIGLQVKLLLLNFFSLNGDSHTSNPSKELGNVKIKSILESLMLQS